ncbi:MAG TPA: hypothetical protein PK847_01580 [Candidatus Sumerlaeota bacterium]|nr:hypothetical protein [Candidatus Sumerlaeota bacterium]HOR27217.1 hypothetical protein [Candidatus Sumerlaeota bacterium]
MTQRLARRRPATCLLFLAVALTAPLGRAQVQPWGGTQVMEWERAAEARIVGDMSRCEPAAALSPDPAPGKWRLIPYETVTGVAGTMIWASPTEGFPPPDAEELGTLPGVALARGGVEPVALPLETEGWHALFVALFSTGEATTRVYMKLDGDPAPVGRTQFGTAHRANLEEVFFKVAQLKPGDRIHFSQQNNGYPDAAGVAYVKLIPLSEAEIARQEADRESREHLRLAASHDGFSTLFHRAMTTPEELLSDIELFRDTDFGTVILHNMGGDKVNYESAVGHMAGSTLSDFARIGDWNFARATAALRRQGINPMQVMIDGARAMGLRVYVAIRPAGWSFWEPLTRFWETPFYRDHPEWRCVDRDGTPVTRMSWAVPEVRAHMIDLLMESVRLGADGAQLVFNRGCPMVLYEPPAREIFERRHGVDPRTLEETDPRIRQWWADIVTTFFQELRAALDEEAERRGDGRRLDLTATVHGIEADNLLYGIDLRRLVSEGLVDGLYIYPWDFGRAAAAYGEIELEFFRDICQPAGIPFYPALGLHLFNAREYAQRAREMYEAGAAGIFVWDAAITDLPKWGVIRRLGHVEELPERIERLAPDPPHEYIQFHRLGPNIMDSRYPPWWGG